MSTPANGIWILWRRPLATGPDVLHSALNPTTARFHRLGTWVYRFRWAVIAAWVCILLVASYGAAHAPDVLKGGAAGIPHSSSARAMKMFHQDFRSPYQYHFLVSVTSERYTIDQPEYTRLLGELQAAVVALPFTTRSLSYLDSPNGAMRSVDGHRTFFVMGLQAKDNLDAEQRVKPTRQALAPVIERWVARDAGLKVYVTGEIPIGYDGTQTLVEDTATAERRILPAALLFLLLAFGALAAAGVPVMMGAMASILTLGLLYVCGQFMNLSAMAQNISTMVGLGIGIDYSLIMVSRFREALARGVSNEDAVAETVATSGQAVVFSGLTVMIGFLALFLPGLIDTTSLAMAGSMTVLASVMIAITMLPAILGVLGPWVDWPFGFSRLIARFSVDAMWYRWAQLVMRYPARFLTAGTALLLVMSAPMFTVTFGQFSSKYLPTGMASGMGLLEMEKMGQAGQAYPISLVIKNTDGQKVFAPATLSALAGVVTELRASPQVQRVDSIVENASRLIVLNNLFFQGDVAALRRRFPEAAGLLISEDGTGTVIQIIPRSTVSYMEVKALVHDLQGREWAKVPGFAAMEVAIGGPAAVNNDFEYAILSNIGKVVGLVFLITFILLYLSFRSVVLPLKALAMNTLSVSASFGVLVLVFQHGWFSSLVGFAEAPGVILVPVPLIVFCCVFGLSMDYEVFLLSRIAEEYQATGDNEVAVARGLAATGGIITNAALIMLLVFGAFIAANVMLTKMLGFGLAVAVLVDALIIRVMLVPSFMALVGRWNWWPNIIEPKVISAQVAHDDVVTRPRGASWRLRL